MQGAGPTPERGQRIGKTSMLQTLQGRRPKAAEAQERKGPSTGGPDVDGFDDNVIGDVATLIGRRHSPMTISIAARLRAFADLEEEKPRAVSAAWVIPARRIVCENAQKSRRRLLIVRPIVIGKCRTHLPEKRPG